MQILSGKSDCDKDLNNNTGLMDKEKIEHSTRSRDNGRIFIYSANERREIGSKVRGKYWMVMDWYRSGNEVVSRKKAERKGFNNTFYIPTDLTDEHG